MIKKIIKRILLVRMSTKHKMKNLSYEISLKAKYGLYNRIGKHVKISSETEIGDYTYINYETIIDGKTIIGKYCSIGPQVYINPGNHPLNLVSTHPYFYDENWNGNNLNAKSSNENKKVEIGNDVWIGSRSIILEGVRIGNGAIIGAGSVVTKDIPDYAIAVGAPAKVIKYRFDEETIKRLNKVKWWEWDIKKIEKNYDKFNDVNKFIKLK